MRFPLVVAWMSLLSLLSPASKADLLDGFSTSNMNPFVRVQGLPTTRSARLASRGQLAWQLQTDFANNFTDNSGSDEAILIDGETHQATLTLRYGFHDRWEAGIDIPWLRHSGGSLDGFIENWHSWFGLPNGGREDVPDDALNFGYLDPVTSLLLDDSTAGIGDIRLHLGYSLGSTTDQRWTLRGGIKLATGDADELTGSEAASMFASLHYDRDRPWGRDNWRFSSSFGAILLGDGEVLEDRQENWAAFGSGTVAWQPWERVSLKAQLDFHTALYDSRLRELGDFSAQLILGGSIRLGERTLLDLSVSEDIVTDTASDVVLQVGFRSSF